jgi:iron complex outermembrane recepter protein
VSATYENGGFTGFLRGRYIGAGVVDNSFTANDIARNRVPARFYLDGTLSYRFSDVRGAPELYLAVDNLLDKAPPTVAPLAANPFLNTGTSPGLYDAIGRSFRFGVRTRF